MWWDPSGTPAGQCRADRSLERGWILEESKKEEVQGPGDLAVPLTLCEEVRNPWVVARLGRGQGYGGRGMVVGVTHSPLATVAWPLVLGLVRVTQFQLVPQRELRLLRPFLLWAGLSKQQGD